MAPARDATTRRSFLKRALAPTVFGATVDALWGAQPRFDGQLLADERSLRACADDYGRQVHRSPVAVLRPGSVRDVGRIIEHASKSGLKVAMRGQGHSLYGQAQVAAGIVIDSSTLNGVRWSGRDTLDVEPGAQWGQVARAALARGLTPPVLPDALMLSAGGTLSVGGTGEMSHRAGAQVDHVMELDVVTGAGRHMTCSPGRNEELYRMTLAGLGQCGLIVRARVRLAPAPTHVEMRALTSDDAAALLSDQAHLAGVDAVGALGGAVTRKADGRWTFLLFAGTFLSQATGTDATPPWFSGLRYKAAAAPDRTSYWDYLDRRTASIGAAMAAGQPKPSLALSLPEDAAAPFLTHVLSVPEVAAGITRIEVFPMVTARFTQPLHRLPTGRLAFTLRLHRRASAAGAPDHEAMLGANRALVTRLQAAGGKVYPPYAPSLSRDEWREHYGPELWRRFAAAKQRFDPANLLTPGAGLFLMGSASAHQTPTSSFPVLASTM